MFGRLKGYYPKEDTETRSMYRSVYCGACYALYSEIGLKGRFLLSYENAAAFALASALIESEPSSTNLRCPLAGFGKKERYVFDFDWVPYIVDLNLYFLWLKSIDDKNDEKGYKRLCASILNRTLKSEIENVKSRLKESGFPVDDAHQAVLERNKMDFSYLDESLAISGHLFGMVGSYVAELFKRDDQKHLLSSAGAVLGKCLDLIDMIEDIRDDITHNRFNPIVEIYSNGNMDHNEILHKAENDIVYLARELCCDLAIHLDSMHVKRNLELIRGIFGRSIERCFMEAFSKSAKCNQKCELRRSTPDG